MVSSLCASLCLMVVYCCICNDLYSAPSYSLQPIVQSKHPANEPYHQLRVLTDMQLAVYAPLLRPHRMVGAIKYICHLFVGQPSRDGVGNSQLGGRQLQSVRLTRTFKSKALAM